MKDKSIIENSGTRLARWIAANSDDMNTRISAEKFISEECKLIKMGHVESDGTYLTKDEK